MIDLHTHTFFSDGVLIPSELFQRARAKGYHTIAVTDHCDASNLQHVISNLCNACLEWNQNSEGLLAVPGVELTYIPPPCISKAVEQARDLGAVIVVVHGETLVESVTPGTNQATIEAGVDILSHPGLVPLDLARLAALKNVSFEITTRKGHSLTNGHVARVCKEAGTKMVLNTDSHTPEDLVSREFALRVVQGCGLTGDDFTRMMENSKLLTNRGLR